MRAPLAGPVAFAALLAARGVAAACGRPTDPGGFDGYDYGDAAVRSFGDASVLVWYTTEGPHAVNPASSRADGVPDDVADVTQVTSDALARYATLGYRAPVSDEVAPACGANGGDERLDVYLVHMIGADGMTVAESGRCTAAGAAARCASFIFAQSNFAGSYATSDTGVRTVLPHEAFHAVQNAYDANLDRFWAEGTAQWAAKMLDPSLTDLERFLPAFFSQTSRALDAPSNGVTSAFLYGAAIWPVFLAQRFGDDVVRAVLEQEGAAGDAALDAAASVLESANASSLAAEYSLFSAWNAGTNTRAGAGGYADAASYPRVDLLELDQGGAQAITSGLSSFFYHAAVRAPTTVTLTTDATRNAGVLVPLANGRALEDQIVPLPAELDGEGIVVVSGVTSKKTDAPFALSLAPAGDAGADLADAAWPSPGALPPAGGGCSLSRCSTRSRAYQRGLLLLGLFLGAPVRRSSRPEQAALAIRARTRRATKTRRDERKGA